MDNNVIFLFLLNLVTWSKVSLAAEFQPWEINAPKPNSIIGFSIDRDSIENSTYSVFLDYTISGDLIFLANVGQSKILVLDAANNEVEEDVQQLGIGVLLHPLEELSYGFNLEFWGIVNQLTINSIQFPIGYHLVNWSFVLEPGYRRLNVTSDPNVLVRKFRINDKVLGIGVSYYGWHPWTLVLSSEKHSYSVDLTRLDTDLASNIFSSTTLGLTSSLSSQTTNFEISYLFNHVTFAIYVGNSISAFDNSKSRHSGVRIGLNYFKNYNIDISAGSSRLADESTTGEDSQLKHVSLGLSYSWK